jgi:hypothetical protein
METMQKVMNKITNRFHFWIAVILFAGLGIVTIRQPAALG